MKILVFSDSHANVSNICDIIDLCKEDTSLIVHLGDMTSDFKKVKNKFPDIPSISVKGNNDFFDLDTDTEYVGILEGVKCLFTHGHQYSVKSGVAGILACARALNADLVLFGHTHMPYKEKRGNTLLFNPGSVGQGGVYTFGILHMSNSFIQSADILYYEPIKKRIDFLRTIR